MKQAFDRVPMADNTKVGNEGVDYYGDKGNAHKCQKQGMDKWLF